MWHSFPRLHRPAWLCALVIGLAPVTASAKALCLRLETTGTQFVIPSFSLKKGKATPVNGWVTGYYTPQLAQVFDKPLSGQAIATSDGQLLTLALTGYGPALVHDAAASTNLSAVNGSQMEVYSVTLAGTSPIAPGTLGSTVHFGVGGTGTFAAITEVTTVLDCAKIPAVFALP